MNRFKWLLLGMLLAGLGVFCSEAWAVREEHSFEVSVQIPGSEFYVLPVNPGFLEREQPMAYNTVTGKLASLREHFDVRSVGGAVTARLGELPSLFSGRNSIALQVTFNGQVLALTNSVVVAQEQARSGARVPLVISAVEPAGGYLPGEYYGTVHLMFEAQSPRF